ncbi:MAG: type II secretion system protein [Sedimentisphaerales bacterium]|nr:type II secretion system protein [Sedimentisphaerales bacterium]
MNARITTGPKAFTFIEVLVALAVAAIGLLSLLRLHLSSMATADVAQAQTQAVFLAQEKLAELSAPDYPQRGTDSGVVERNGLRLAWTTEITDAHSRATGGWPLRGLRQVRCTVAWQQGASRKTVQMDTYIADSRTNEPKPQ